METKKVFASFSCLFLLLASSPVKAQGFGGARLSMGKNRSEINPRQPAGPLDQKQGEGKNATTYREGGSEFGANVEYQIHLLGQVENPGTYRLAPSTRLDEALSKAGAILDLGSQRRVEIRRDEGTLYCDLFKFQRFGDLKQNPFLMNNDVVFVPYIGNSVAVKGPVKSGGVYELLADEKTLWDLLKLAGGYTVGLSEKDPITVVRFENGRRKLLKTPNVQSELAQFELLNGDVVIIPHFLAENRHFDYNITDLPSDNIYLPTQKNEIYVTGAVGQPGPYQYSSASSVRDFVNMAGPTELSRLKSIYVLTADGRYVKYSKKNFHLSPGDTIVVPKRHFTTDNTLKWYSTLTSTIFTSFALKQLLQ